MNVDYFSITGRIKVSFEVSEMPLADRLCLLRKLLQDFGVLDKLSAPALKQLNDIVIAKMEERLNGP